MRGAGAVELARALEEVRILRVCSHPNIIEFRAAFVDENVRQQERLYILLELADESLRKKLNDLQNSHNRMDGGEIAEIMFDVADGMAYLHSSKRMLGLGARIVHRDLKPDNILLCNGVAKISDFGLSRLLQDADNSASISRRPGTLM